MTDLLKIPGVGKNIKQHLLDLGYDSVEALQGQKPEECNDGLCSARTKLDRCLLYVYQTAVYFAENDVHDPEKLKWWNWKSNVP